MPKPMVFVRRVLMGVREWRVTMRMGVRLAGGIQRAMLMLMVFVMCVRMLMGDGIVSMEMFLMFGALSPWTDG